MTSIESIEKALVTTSVRAEQFYQNMEIFVSEGEVIAGRTNRIIKTAIIVIAIAIIYMLYLIWDLSGDIILLSNNMIDMYQQFGKMTTHVTSMTKSVTKMGDHTDTIPEIAQDMKDMNRRVAGMQHSVTAMDQSVTQMDRDMYLVTTNVQEMTARFGTMTGSVQGMGWNVNQMRQPTDMLPPFFGR